MITTETKAINAVFFGNGTASHCWRIDGIAERINRNTEHSIYVTDWQKWNGRLPEGCNLVILEMLASPKMVERIHELGAKIIWEADDAMIDSYGKERKNLSHMSDDHRQWTIDTLKAVDAITVTNKTLKENYARFTDKPIYVLPNYVDFEWYGEDRLEIKRTTDEVRIGWFGSQGHLEDLHMIIPALNQVLAKYQNAKFVYCGFGGMSSDKKITQIGWGEDVFRSIPRDRREFYIGVREDYWPMKHRTLDLDIGICPLIDDEFNKNKTPIKWMEFGVLGTPSVCSPTLYGEVVRDGVDGLIANNEKDWVTKLSTLIEDAALRKTIGKNAQQRISEDFNLDSRWEDFTDVYSRVVFG